MTPHLYHLLTAVIFIVISVLHAVRIILGWPAVIGDWAAPLWVSWAGLVVPGFLAYWGFRLAWDE